MVEKKAKKIILLDAHAIIHRAYHALPNFTSDKGEPTGALYGLSAMIMKIIKDLDPNYLIACYDLPEPTFRHEAYKEYKQGRKEADDELISQLIKSKEIFDAFGIPIYEKVGFEADDIIGTIAQNLKKDKYNKIIIASGDMDTLQLVENKQVQVYTLKKGINDTILYDEEKVKERFGFDPKYLVDYKGLRGDPSDNIPGVKGIGEKIATLLIQKFGSIESIYKTLEKDRNILLKNGFKERVVKLLEDNKEEAKFSKVLGEIKRDTPIDIKLSVQDWKLEKHKEDIINKFSELGFRSLENRLRESLTSEEPLKVDINKHVRKEDLEKTALALWVVNSNITNPDISDILRYANTRAFSKAQEKILRDLDIGKLRKVYEEIELPLMPILKKAEKKGVLIDIQFLKKLSQEYHKKLNKLEKEIWEVAGEEFNINSPKQMGEILYDKLKIKVTKIKKTEGGARTTKASELEKLKNEHPIIDKIIQYRELQKLLSTYIDNIPDLIAEDDRLHTQYIQTGTTTGRLASQNPNLQNIPIKSELGRNVRKAFIAQKGYKLVSFDYSQMELRVAALLSKDENLIKIFKEKQDVHSATASLMFKTSIEKVTTDMRRSAKVINFGILYGMGVNALKQNLSVSREEAQDFYDEYFSTFKTLARYFENVKTDAQRNGFTETLFGRRRYFPGLSSSLSYIRAQEERMAINAPIQGTSADIIKKAMILIDDRLQKEKRGSDSKILLQIHDELMYEIEENKIQEISIMIKGVMENVIKSEVPFVVDIKAGYNWEESKAL